MLRADDDVVELSVVGGEFFLLVIGQQADHEVAVRLHDFHGEGTLHFSGGAGRGMLDRPARARAARG
ncbi:hypothetical protein RB201_38600 [Streptomyces sp. S1A(2023)]